MRKDGVRGIWGVCSRDIAVLSKCGQERHTAMKTYTARDQPLRRLPLPHLSLISSHVALTTSQVRQVHSALQLQCPHQHPFAHLRSFLGHLDRPSSHLALDQTYIRSQSFPQSCLVSRAKTDPNGPRLGGVNMCLPAMTGPWPGPVGMPRSLASQEEMQPIFFFPMWFCLYT